MTQILNSRLTPGATGAPALRFTANGLAIFGNTQPIRYAILSGSPQLTWGAGDRTASETYLMGAVDVPGFVNMAIGLDVPWYGAPFLMRHKRRMPGNPDLIASRISATPAEGRPADPFLTDPIAADEATWSETYSRHMAVTIEYSTADVIEPGLEDSPSDEFPESFCEVKSTTGQEFLNVGQQNTWFVGTNHRSADDGGFWYLPEDANNPLWHIDGGQLSFVPLTEGKIEAAKPNGGFDVSFNYIVGHREYTVIWRHVFHIPALTIANAKGKVNNSRMPIFANAPTETVLFMGETVTEEPLRAPDGRKLYTIEYKFVERQVRLKETDSSGAGSGVQPVLKMLGWNHFWRAGKDKDGSGWGRLITDRGTSKDVYDRSVYQLFDFTLLFRAEMYGFLPMPAGINALYARQARENSERGNSQINTSP